MKRILTFLGCVLIFLLGACANMKDRFHVDKATAKSSREIRFNEAKELVEKMATLSDQRAWFDLEQVFANHTVYNYGTPEILTPTQIVDRWKPVLSYFTRTNQDISNFQFRETQGRILGSANFTQYHERKSDVTLRGQYSFEFTRNKENQLRIMRITMIPGSAIGDEALLRQARKVSPPEKYSYTTETVNFISKENKLSGWLLKPLNPKSRDVIVISGPLMTVKEQVAYPYAKKFVEKGFPVLVFDSTGFGESEGAVRNQETPISKIKDLLASVDYLTARTEYEHSKINLIGIDASAGYTAHEAAADPRISRLVLVAPTFIGDDKVDILLTDYYVNSDRGDMPQGHSQLTAATLKSWTGFDATPAAAQIRVPTLLIDSVDGLDSVGVKRFISQLRIKPELKTVKAEHEDFYDRSAQMTVVVNSATDFFNKDIILEPLRQAQEE